MKKVTITGAGIAAAFEAYYYIKEAEKRGEKVRITMNEKNGSLSETTASNLVPSLTPDEILAVVPFGPAFLKAMEHPFYEPGGIRADDVPDIDSDSSRAFIARAEAYSHDEAGHARRVKTLLQLGKLSMELWQKLYVEGDAELKAILDASNFHSCREPEDGAPRALYRGYRIDLIYGMDDADKKAAAMAAEYAELGYKHCALLSPDEVEALDPFLAHFCAQQSEEIASGERVWKKDAMALWRPGGCIDTHVFLPLFYEYLKKRAGTYTTATGEERHCFKLKLNRHVKRVDFEGDSIKGVRFFKVPPAAYEAIAPSAAATITTGTGTPAAGGASASAATIPTAAVTTAAATAPAVGEGDLAESSDEEVYPENEFVFCPGEEVKALAELGFDVPAYAGFAGASLILRIRVPEHLIGKYKNFNHYMEIHRKGIVLAWQGRFKDGEIILGVAGTKAFYGDKKPLPEHAFIKDRNVVQLQIMNDILPDFLSLALERDTKTSPVTVEDLRVAKCWGGTRAVAFDGYPTLGRASHKGSAVPNGFVTTHLGSGGVSNAPGAVKVGHEAGDDTEIRHFSDPRR
jgi:hypothetical protein